MPRVSALTLRIGFAVMVLAIVGLTTVALSRTVASPSSQPRPDVAVARPASTTSEDALLELAGRVRGADGSAIAGALICDHPAFAAPTMCGRSGNDGAFALSVARGFHKLEIVPPAGSLYLAAWFDERGKSREADLLDLRVHDVSGLVVTLAAGHRVSGRVVGNGVPVADAQACFDPTEIDAEWVCARTDSDGRYVAVVDDGRYQAFFVPPENTRLIPMWWRSGDQVLAADPIAIHGDLPGIDITLPPGYLIIGRVTSTSGKPIENALVCADTRFPTGRICRPTDKGGNYTVSVRRGVFLVQVFPPVDAGVVASWYRATSDPNAAEDVAVSYTDVRVDPILRSGKLLWGSIRGDDGHPLEGATFNVYDADRCCTFVTGGKTGISGDYAVVVPTGRFYLEVFPPLGQPYISGYYGGVARRTIDVREKDSDFVADVTLESVHFP